VFPATSSSSTSAIECMVWDLRVGGGVGVDCAHGGEKIEG